MYGLDLFIYEMDISRVFKIVFDIIVILMSLKYITAIRASCLSVITEEWRNYSYVGTSW